MPVSKRKDVSIWEDLLGWFRTHREVQLALVVGPIVLVVIFMGLMEFNQREEVKAARPAPQKIVFQQVSDLQFFDTKIGAPLIWYTKDSTGYTLYNAEGYDSNGVKLQVITQGEVESIKTWGEQVMQKKQLMEKQAEIASLQSLFRFSDIPPGTKAFLLSMDTRVLPASAQATGLGQFSEQLTSLLPAETIKLDAITDTFYSRGYFDQAYQGNSGFLDEAGVFDHAGDILLIKPSVTFSNASVQGVMSCHLTLSCRLYASSVKETRQAVFSATGPGFSEEASFKRAMEVVFETNHDKISQFITGK